MKPFLFRARQRYVTLAYSFVIFPAHNRSWKQLKHQLHCREASVDIRCRMWTMLHISPGRWLVSFWYGFLVEFLLNLLIKMHQLCIGKEDDSNRPFHFEIEMYFSCIICVLCLYLLLNISATVLIIGCECESLQFLLNIRYINHYNFSKSMNNGYVFFENI